MPRQVNGPGARKEPPAQARSSCPPPRASGLSCREGCDPWVSTAARGSVAEVSFSREAVAGSGGRAPPDPGRSAADADPSDLQTSRPAVFILRSFCDKFRSMARISPFRALRPDPRAAPRVSSVPYDVISTAEARELVRGNPLSLLHVTRSEIGFPEDQDPHAPEVYTRAFEELCRIRREAPLVVESAPSLYVYRLQMGSHVQTGVAAMYSIAEYESGSIRRHEKTRRDKEDDRTRHILATRSQTGVVFLTYRAQRSIDDLVAQVVREEPLYDFRSPDEVAHTVWRVAPGLVQALVESFRTLPELFIADGHHRAASAWRASGEFARLLSRPGAPADLGSGFLAVAFPHDQVKILPYHRLVRDLAGHRLEDFWQVLASRWQEVEAAPQPSLPGRVSVFAGNQWRTFLLNPPSSAGIASALDCQRLQDQLLEPVLNITDPRSDSRIDFVGGIRGTAELERRVRSGEMAVAFALFPVTLEQLFAVAEAGEIMPPKSTWFEPKLRDGLVIATIDGGEDPA